MAASPSGPIAALVVAAGRGSRAGGEIPKQYRVLGGASILARSLRPFLDHPAVGSVTAVIHPDDRPLYDAAVERHPKLGPPVDGGPDRQASVRLGLEALAGAAPAGVLIHDAARPFVSRPVIDRVIAALAGNKAVLPALPVADTLKRADGNGSVTETISRDGVFAAQTPQGFDFEAILGAHREAAGGHTDDSAIAESAGLVVKIVAGDPANVKMTTNEDMANAEQRLAADIRIGNGYDVHAFGAGDHVMLGGVRIAHDRALVGHSDADVVLHALTDAILGAIAAEDIGAHFPPSDPALSGAASVRFLAFAAGQVKARGGIIGNLDVTVIAERPKLGPHRDAMRERIAEICGIRADRVSVKATTNERLGFIGREEGIAALATATVRLPFMRA